MFKNNINFILRSFKFEMTLVYMFKRHKNLKSINYSISYIHHEKYKMHYWQLSPLSLHSPGTPGWPFFMPLQAATATPQSPSLSFSSIPRHDLSFFITCRRKNMMKREMQMTQKTYRWCHSQLFFVAELVNADQVSHHRHLVTERKFKILIMILIMTANVLN